MSILIIKQQKEMGGWPGLFRIGRVLFFFRSSVAFAFAALHPPSYWQVLSCLLCG